MDNASSVALNINCSIVQLNGVKLLGADLDTGGAARIIFLAGNTEKATISGYKEQGVAVAGGTTKYPVAFGSSSTRVYVPDQSIPYSEISDNGFYHQVNHGGRFYSRTASAPSLGTWERGDTVYNRAPSVDVNNMVLSHWVCTVAGTPGTWTPQYLSTVSPAT